MNTYMSNINMMQNIGSIIENNNFGKNIDIAKYFNDIEPNTYIKIVDDFVKKISNILKSEGAELDMYVSEFIAYTFVKMIKNEQELFRYALYFGILELVQYMYEYKHHIFDICEIIKYPNSKCIKYLWNMKKYSVCHFYKGHFYYKISRNYNKTMKI